MVYYPIKHHYNCGKNSISNLLLRWLETVSSTFQDLEFNGSLQPLYTC